MRQIRTTEELQEFLDDELGWRIKDIDNIRSAASIAKVGSSRTLVRAGIALLYAHWEGFVKASASGYVSYVDSQGLRHSELRSCFVAMSLRARIKEVSSTWKARPMVAALETILDGQDDRAALRKKDVVGRRGNLNFRAFKNVANWLGVDAERYMTRSHFIDDRLLKRRNEIAHGKLSDLELDRNGFEELVNGVVQLLRWFKADIENAITNKAFQRPKITT